jgi:TatD DNase family protein
MTLSFPDSHCHLQDERFSGEMTEVLARAREAGVATVLLPGTDPDTSERAAELAQEYGLWFSAGTHPEDPARHDEGRIRALLSHPRCVAVGEIGLDYHYPPFDRQSQEQLFRSQIRLAREAGLPIVIHNREADRDTVRILRDEGSPGGVFHCFGGDRECLDAALSLDFFISFAGNLTYPKASFRELAPLVPRERLLVETDAPYLSPVPFRGKPNEPARAALVLAELACLRGEDVRALGEACLDNFRHCFPRTATA